MAPYVVMAKKCGFCSFSTDDETAFTEHMRTVHQWGVPAAPAATITLPPPGEPGVPRFCGACGAPRDAESTNFCRNCGTPFTGGATVTRKEASPAFAVKAGFWRRLGSYLFDILVLGVLGLVVSLVIGMFAVLLKLTQPDIDTIANLFSNLLVVAYFCWFWSGRGQGQTVGMRALGLRLIRTDGTYIGIGRAFLRNIGLSLGVVAFGLGVLSIVWDKQKQGWHDKMTDTYVIRT